MRYQTNLCIMFSMNQSPVEVNSCDQSRNVEIAHEIMRTLRSAKFELGIRNATFGSDKNKTLTFTIGMQKSTSKVDVTLNALDLYDVNIYQERKIRNSFTTKKTSLGSLSNVGGEFLAQCLVREWCKICGQKGW